jgi:hypothetical protein
MRAETGIDLTTVPAARRDALRAAIARRGGVVDWTAGSAGWAVTLHLPQERTFCGGTLEDGLAACLAWFLVAEPDSGMGYG